ncbi:MAG: hypothetical protein CMQ75_05125 [Gammaproteobacteria bacterium]|nr:hypothetical protein [Gammaproteobacteria bacterium]|tara:strand:+ start:635 stop:925 length:291 start_codon:yes stop_codon:yes gene_type:complete
MRSKDTGDGRKILAKVEVPLSVEDIATYALRYLDEIDDDDPKDTLVSANKREIFNMAKTAIFKWGTQEPKLYVAENMNGHFEPIHKVVKAKFPECD